jgi:hypothetical protein
VLACILKGGDGAEELVFVDVQREHGRDVHTSGGDRSGLVQDDGVDLTSVFKNLGPANHDTELRAAARPDKERSWRRKTEGAGAGNDEHRDSGLECCLSRR